MGNREKLKLWVREALGQLGSEGLILDVMKQVWAVHQTDITQSGDGFYTWQYDIRWAADELRKEGALGLRKAGAKSIWILKP
ncbi:MAG: uncharacterized protein JWO16_452 [Sphingomonas bacterium]|nr:uncharacterized protein [Sphingomonas bacterium]